MSTEQQNLEHTKKMIAAIISCIAYIREFFPDETFMDSKVFDMSLKLLKKGVSDQADRLMSWISTGCFDALAKKYLRVLRLGISEDHQNPDNVLESYAISITYPSSKIHQMLSTPMISFSVDDHGDKDASDEKKEQSIVLDDSSFPSQIVKILRLLCVMTQTLRSLPTKKFITMHLEYYDELTPRDYEPEGFQSTVFDTNYLFTDEPFKHSFGMAACTNYQIAIDLETLQAAKVNEKKGEDQCLIVDTQETIIEQSNELINKEEEENKVPQHTFTIKCLCGDNQSDLDMIQCDFCKLWMHTPCAGFCTNKDTRIPENYKCISCQYSRNLKLQRNMTTLASMRRAISVIYSEGIESIRWFSKRLGCGLSKASKLLRRLQDEEMITKPSTQRIGYTVNKTRKTLSRVKYYFSQDLGHFPELRPFLRGMKDAKSASATMATKRKSKTCSVISCS